MDNIFIIPNIYQLFSGFVEVGNSEVSLETVEAAVKTLRQGKLLTPEALKDASKSVPPLFRVGGYWVKDGDDSFILDLQSGKITSRDIWSDQKAWAVLELGLMMPDQGPSRVEIDIERFKKLVKWSMPPVQLVFDFFHMLYLGRRIIGPEYALEIIEEIYEPGAKDEKNSWDFYS